VLLHPQSHEWVAVSYFRFISMFSVGTAESACVQLMRVTVIFCKKMRLCVLFSFMDIPSSFFFCSLDANKTAD